MIEMKNRRENNDKGRSQVEVKKEMVKFLGNGQNDEYDTVIKYSDRDMRVNKVKIIK